MRRLSFFPKPSAKPQRTLQLRGLRKLPHVVLFWIVNMAYCGPVLLAYAFSFSEGGVDQTLDVQPREMVRFTWIYATSMLAFLAGAWFVWKFPLHKGGPGSKAPYADQIVWPKLDLATALIGGGLVLTKILLIPQGVYGTYAFDGDLMSGGIWTLSMFFSESMVILTFAALIRDKRVTSRLFLFSFACVSTNLLHGTRIFTTATILGVLVYFWITREISRKLLLRAALGLIGMGLVLYIAFASRADYQYSADANSLTIALSPIVYEAVFSQMSLIQYLKNFTPDIFGHPFAFVVDVISFITPRIINPNKDSGGALEPYAWLAPLGAFAGHAAGLIYFGYCLPAFYFLLGGLGSWLQRAARTNPAFFVVYIYFTGDILFRLMRDGYIYPAKYLFNGVVIIFLVATATYHTSSQRARKMV